jgi:lysozyme
MPSPRVLRPRTKGALVPVAIATAVVVVLGLFGAGVVFGSQIYARLELARLRYQVIGVDVSHHQGHIDWSALAGAGIAFAYVKATEGANFQDADFATNWTYSALAGLPRGAYHFFTLCRSGSDQARNFIATVPNDPQALPPVVDAESMGPCQNGAPALNVAQEIETFLARVEKHFGRRPLIYTTAEFDDAYLIGRFPHDRFWIRSLVIPPLFRHQQWVLWQYHDRGRRPGVQGPVDLSAFRGSKTDFAAFTQSNP